MKALAVLLVAGAMAVAGCSSGADEPSTTVSDPGSPTTSSATTTLAPASSSIEDAPDLGLDGNISWVVEVLNGAPTSSAEVSQRFSELLEQYVPPTDFLVVVDQLRSDISKRWVETDRRVSGPTAEVALDTDDGVWAMAISVQADGQIETLLLEPRSAEAQGPPLTSFDDLVGRLERTGRSSVLVAEVTEGACDPVYRYLDVVRPIASDFKLYVLGALADAISRGDLAWDDAIVIDDGLKSLPSGTFQTRPEGSEATVLEFAQAMIAVSDNTATDHLIDHLTRANVEAALADYHMAEAALNMPFLTTREFFSLKLAVSDDVADTYIAGDEAQRRALLSDEVAGSPVTLSDAGAWVTPRRIDDIEWFASPTSLCEAMVELIRTADAPETAEIREILSRNPGTPFAETDWSYVGYKGGSEPGVLSLVWYLEAPDGRAYVFVVSVSNPDEPLPEADLARLAGSAFDLIAELGD